jgi:hypothetical protein
MRSFLTKLTLLVFFTLVLAACSDAGTAQVAEMQAPPPPSQPATSPSGLQGQVLQTMDSGGYTYVLIHTGDREIWAAAPTTPIQLGDQITVVGAMEMSNFRSKTLERTFDSLWFASRLVKAGKEGEAASMPGNGDIAAHGAASPGGAPALALTVEAGTVPKAEGGHTVAELFAGRNELSGQQVAVRGKVVKFSARIMGRNWIHLQDGTGGPGTNDLTVTCAAQAEVGDLVLIRGTVATDKDFGAGYKYDVIIEDAQIASGE